tara:strand:- start:71 stop:232 length:162 start_codon:yes stop_codon:yes gene_type:complete
MNKYIALAIVCIMTTGCSAIAVVDVAASTAIYAGKTVVNTIDLITPDIINDEE